MSALHALNKWLQVLQYEYYYKPEIERESDRRYDELLRLLARLEAKTPELREPDSVTTTVAVSKTWDYGRYVKELQQYYHIVYLRDEL